MAQTATDNLLKNPGFEQPVLAGGWVVNASVLDKGLGGQSVFDVHSGKYSLRLVPNALNEAGLGQAEFGVAQSLDPAPYRGKSLYFSGWLGATGGATAVLRLVAVSSSGAVWYRELRQSGSTPSPLFHRDILDVPDDPAISVLTLTCTAMGVKGSAWFDDLTVSTEIPQDWLAATGAQDSGPALPALIHVDAGAVLRTLPRTLYGMNVEWVWNGNGLYNPAYQGLDPSLLGLTQAMGPTVLRFPGGFFSDFYHWEDGVGPVEKRPEGRTLSPGHLSANSFGTDELLRLAGATGAQPLFTVNVLTGTPEEAAAWVRYTNSGGRKVLYWEVGNEPYVDLQQFDPSAGSLPPEEYAARFLTFARAMKAVDPGIKVGAALDYNYGFTTYKAYPNWTDTLLQVAGREIDFVTVHNGFAPVIGLDAGWPARTVYESMMAAPQLVADTLASLDAKINALVGPDSHITIAISEWGPLFQDQFSSRFFDHVKTLGSALYVASMLNAFIENPRTELATAFKLVDRLSVSWIGVRNGEFAAKAPSYALEMYTRHFGSQLVASSTSSPTYSSRSMGWVDAVREAPYLDEVASLDDTGLYLMVVNRHFDRDITATISLRNFCPSGADADVWTLNGTAVDANTGTQVAADAGLAPQAHVDPGSRFDQGGADEVWMRASTMGVSSPYFSYTFAPHSVTSIKVPGSTGVCSWQSPEIPESPAEASPR